MEPTKPTFASSWQAATEEAQVFSNNPRHEEITNTFVQLVYMNQLDGR